MPAPVASRRRLTSAAVNSAMSLPLWSGGGAGAGHGFGPGAGHRFGQRAAPHPRRDGSAAPGRQTAFGSLPPVVAGTPSTGATSPAVTVGGSAGVSGSGVAVASAAGA